MGCGITEEQIVCTALPGLANLWMLKGFNRRDGLPTRARIAGVSTDGYCGTALLDRVGSMI